MSAVLYASKEINFNIDMDSEDQLKNSTMKNCNNDDDHETDQRDNDFYGHEDEDEHEDDTDDDADQTEKHEEEEDRELKHEQELDIGPQFSLKEQIEKDKDDESLKRWKEQLLGSNLDISALGESKEAEVKIVSLAILCPGRPDLVLPIPFAFNSKKNAFTLKEGSRYRLKFSFIVSKNIVSGLKYTNTIWRTGVKVDSTKIMLGTFSPQQEIYTYELDEETTPSGLFARGSYSARTMFIDDDGKSYLDISYQFDIKKKWPASP